MIKPEELRIGNYIEYNTLHFKVSGIRSPKPLKDIRYSDKWIIELLDNGFIDSPNEFIKPIEVTEEWLLKFGFEQKFLSYSNEKLRLYKLEDGWYRELWMNGSYGADPYYNIHDDEIPITSVHQLQNLYFALTGSELTIKEQ